MEPGAVVVTPGGSDVPEKVEYGTCIWTTGIKMHPLTQQIMATLPGGVFVPWWRISKALWQASRRCRRLPDLVPLFSMDTLGHCRALAAKREVKCARCPAARGALTAVVRES